MERLQFATTTEESHTTGIDHPGRDRRDCSRIARFKRQNPRQGGNVHVGRSKIAISRHTHAANRTSRRDGTRHAAISNTGVQSHSAESDNHQSAEKNGR